MSKLRDTDIKRNDLYSKSFRKHMRKTVVPDKTTYMLVIMISVFLATELPQGFLALLNGELFQQRYYCSFSFRRQMLIAITTFKKDGHSAGIRGEQE